MKHFRALASVPAIDVIACYEELIDSLSDELVDDLSDFLHYFEKTWIGLEHHGRRRCPLFPIELWNVRDRVERALPRTNNSVEGWHRAFDSNKLIQTLNQLMRHLVVNYDYYNLIFNGFRHNVLRRDVLSARCPFGTMSFGKMSFGEMSFGKVS